MAESSNDQSTRNQRHDAADDALALRREARRRRREMSATGDSDAAAPSGLDARRAGQAAGLVQASAMRSVIDGSAGRRARAGMTGQASDSQAPSVATGPKADPAQLQSRQQSRDGGKTDLSPAPETAEKTPVAQQPPAVAQTTAQTTLVDAVSVTGKTIRASVAALTLLPSWLIAKVGRPQLRLLPSVIFVAVIMLGVRVGDVWTGIQQGGVFGVGSPSAAQDVVEAPVEPGVASGAGQGGDQPATQVASTDSSGPGLLESLRREGRSPTEMELLEELVERRNSLEDRERALSEREAMQQIAERRLEEKLTELEDLRGQIRTLLGEVDGERERQLTGLVAIYENMRPGDAATIFNGLDMDVLIDVLDRMAQRRSAPILASMLPERARAVTRELADRGQLPDLQPLQD